MARCANMMAHCATGCSWRHAFLPSRSSGFNILWGTLNGPQAKVVRERMNLIGVLLAAGRGARFDASAQRLKLLEPYPRGRADAVPLALAAARKLLAFGPVIAVVRAPSHAKRDAWFDANQARLRELLAGQGCQVLCYAKMDGEGEGAAKISTAGAACATALEGTGTSIARAVQASAAADGWIVALADMPEIQAATIAAVRQALEDGALTAAPYYRGRRGHPVGFAAACGAELAALTGDDGARAVLERHPPVRIDVDDPGVLFDVDQPEDLDHQDRAGTRTDPRAPTRASRKPK